MFPLSDSIPARRFPFLNYILIGITIFVFIQQLLAPDPEAFVRQYALTPSLVDFTNLITLLPFVTAMFLHGGFMHIISNMWFLKVFGDNVEGHLNPILYLFLYFGSGVAGNILQYVLSPQSTIPMLGASGAVAGILGYYFTVFSHSRIKTLVFIFFFVTIIEIRAGIMLGYWFFLQIFSGFGSVSELANQGGVAFFAHIGGFVFGVIFAKLFGREDSDVIEGEIVE